MNFSLSATGRRALKNVCSVPFTRAAGGLTVGIHHGKERDAIGGNEDAVGAFYPLFLFLPDVLPRSVSLVRERSSDYFSTRSGRRSEWHHAAGITRGRRADVVAQ
ncbi:protein of unknown function [Serratia sp. Tan611]|nr:protein of unknown function [Serratia sp. Tan611]